VLKDHEDQQIALSGIAEVVADLAGAGVADDDG
jgi:hypothetical protein